MNLRKGDVIVYAASKDEHDGIGIVIGERIATGRFVGRYPISWIVQRDLGYFRRTAHPDFDYGVDTVFIKHILTHVDLEEP